jgi:hypothetical protein
VQFYDLLISAADDALVPLGGSDTPAGGRVAEMRDFFAFVRGAMPGLLAQWEASRQPGVPAQPENAAQAGDSPGSDSEHSGN